MILSSSYHQNIFTLIVYNLLQKEKHTPHNYRFPKLANSKVHPGTHDGEHGAGRVLRQEEDCLGNAGEGRLHEATAKSILLS